ncbi:MAG: LON peptidase substrate-binding domain-containing protein [Gemmataceae bacterium]
MSDDERALAEFGGMARLFPLPNLVLFPHVPQPLHVFEPRYRQLTADALDGDGLIAMALLRPGWEDTNPERPPIYPVACLGRIIANRKLEDGRYILLLRGLSRLRVVQEVPSDRLYRVAQTQLLPDVSVFEVAEAKRMRRRLKELVTARFTGSASDKAQLREIFDGEVSLAALCDGLCHQLPLTIERKMELLEETDVMVRVQALLTALEGFTLDEDGPRKWPPEFSVN